MAVVNKPQLILVCIADTDEPVEYAARVRAYGLTCVSLRARRYLARQLDLLYQHVLFHVTAPALAHVFASNPSYDLSVLLGGTEGEAHGLIHEAHYNLSLLLDATPVQALSAPSRRKLVALLETCCKGVALFGLVLSTHGLLMASHSPSR